MSAATIGFGAPTWDGAHRWLIRTPRQRDAAVTLLEDYGRNGWPSGIYEPVVRAIVPRTTWSAVAPALQIHLNGRLKDAGFPRGKLIIGDVPVERLLGTEACLLAWAIDDATPDQAREAFDSLRTYMPCEVRCLYQYAARDRDLSRPAYGWRKAIKFALIASLSKEPAVGTQLELLDRTGGK
ncbi:DUF3780 domain-containing protein [Sphingomonas sanguinis]|uniref:DUF3780 domain-containing protein n=1 Tax=Sphingomonas sp. LC-1 TaxID=3110957 RepID=UPI0021BB8D4A|nr:DUF3780 domain-containing protein [Sphingomonas sp. LC-1]MCT8000545.1 DUF3780 domain-containing protein [Sphingomonas sp. LC-1]